MSQDGESRWEPAGDREEILLDHILECDLCLSVISDCTLPVEECEIRCSRYRDLLQETRDSSDCKAASGGQD